MVKEKSKISDEHVNLDVTGMKHAERLKTIDEYSKRKGFVEYKTTWQDQFTPCEKMFYTFIYRARTGKKRSAAKK